MTPAALNLTQTQTISESLPAIHPLLRLSQPVLDHLAYWMAFIHLAVRRYENDLPGVLRYVPFFCRLIAMTLAAPFVLCIILDLIAYGIVRTLHLSMSSHRVPRSPPPANMPLGVHSPHFESEHRENFVSLTPSSDQFGEAANGESEVRRTKPGRRKQASFEVAESTAEIPNGGKHVTEGLGLGFPLDVGYTGQDRLDVDSKSSSMLSLDSLVSTSSTQTSNGSSVSLGDGPATNFETRFPPVTQRSRQPRSQETKQNTLYMSKKTSIDRETPS